MTSRSRGTESDRPEDFRGKVGAVHEAAVIGRLGLVAIAGLVAGCSVFGGSNATPSMQHIASTANVYSIDLPASWIVLRTDGATGVGAQVDAAKTAHPEMASLIDYQKGLVERGIDALLAFDPAGFEKGQTSQVDLKDLPVGTFADAGAAAESMRTELESQGESIDLVDVVQLPGGPAARVRHTGPNAQGLELAVTDYIIVGEKHSMWLTFSVSAGDLGDYEPLYDQIVRSWRL